MNSISVGFISLVITAAWSADAKSEGIVILTPHNFSARSDANEALAFKSVKNRTGVYEFQWNAKSRGEVPIGRIVAIAEAPIPLPDITEAYQLESLTAYVQRVEQLGAKHPAVQATLRLLVSESVTEITRFQKGERKLNGFWVVPEEYRRLQSLAESVASDARAQERDTKAQEHCDLLTSQLQETSSFATSEKLVKELKSSERGKTTAQVLLSSWDRIYKESDDLRKEIRALCLKASKDTVISSYRSAKKLSDLQRFPRQILSEVDALTAKVQSTQTRETFSQLNSIFALESTELIRLNLIEKICRAVTEKNFKSATELALLDVILFEGELGAVLKSVTTCASTNVIRANEHLKKANELEVDGKIDSAIRELRAAHGILLDPTIQKRIDELGKDTLGL